MDSDATLDGEVDHSFFDSDGERPPRAPGPGQGPEKDAEYSRTVSSTACSSSSASRSSCSSLSSGRELVHYRTKSPGYASDSSSKSRSSRSRSSSSSGRDEAGDRAGRSRSRSPSPRAAPVIRWLHSRTGQTRAEQPLSNPDSDSSASARSSSDKWQRTRLSAKTRTGRSHDLCRPKKRLPEAAVAVALAAGARKRHEDEQSTVTDVTPLSSPARSPVRPADHQSEEPKPKPRRKRSSKKQENVSQAIYNSLDRMSVDKEKGEGVHRRARKQKKPRETKSCNLNSKTSSMEYKRPDQRIGQKILNDATDLNQLLRAMMHLERKELRKIVSDFPEQRQKKNYTFSNEEAKRIDRENQRLLHELTRKATRPPVKPKKISAETVRVYHSTLNRQREQERIERENLAFLKRLEAVKPTVGLKRSTQLYDYQRQMAFMESYSQHSRPSTRGSMSRLSSRSSVHKNVHLVSN
ncbi:cilia- and flagella-associated protein 97 isoform X1 [Leucoraja erinacea]|uniref:cilia- and flagella-associated protein 97 isoform X1 n=1 Tax=Leucoraja erinaceus TaxID=7782 RepID=UPI002453F75A|nr:cilia- and flagella-associated protein 97 isoform X1 [Leucoraja erinacea]